MAEPRHSIPRSVTIDLPAPLTPADCDVSDTSFAEMREAVVLAAASEWSVTRAEAEAMFDQFIRVRRAKCGRRA